MLIQEDIMNNIFVYCEVEEGIVSDVSLELLTKGKSLSANLNCKLEAVVLGTDLNGIEKEISAYGVDIIHIADDSRLFPFTTIPHTSILIELIKKEEPSIVLFGATSIGRDLAPRVSSALKSGLTADCTSLVIGDHLDKKSGKEYKNLLYQIRPAFGGNIIATIINPDHRPQMATVREGVMKKEIHDSDYKSTIKKIDLNGTIKDEDFLVKIIKREIENKKINIKNGQIIIAGGYGVGSKENFKLLFDLAEIIGAEVGGSRAAVDAGYIDHDRQIGQTGVTVRPKLYIACGISGQIQHRAGMDESVIIISINTDPNAPINKISDYVIIGEVGVVIPQMIKSYKQNTK